MKGLYAIVDTMFLARRRTDPIAYARAMIEARPAALQLRGKDVPARTFLGLLRELSPICRQARVPLVANDRVDLAALGGCQMVHIGQEDLPYELVHRIAPQLAIGISTHNVEQLGRALTSLNPNPGGSAATSPGWTTEATTGVTVTATSAAPAASTGAPPPSSGAPSSNHMVAAMPSYVAYGPVFATTSKAQPDPVVGIEGLRAASALARAAHVPLVAIGGITLERVPEIASLIDCCAVIGDLYPEGATLAQVTERALAFQAALGVSPSPISTSSPSTRSLSSKNTRGAA